MSDQFLEQRIKIKFCAKIGKHASRTCVKLSEGYGGQTMKKSSVFKRHKRIKEGRDNA
jgi:hypothetical protein